MQTARIKVAHCARLAVLALAGALLAVIGTSTVMQAGALPLAAGASPSMAIPCRSDPIIRYVTASGQHVETLRIVASYRAVRPQPTRFLVRLPRGARVVSVWRESASEHVSIVVGGAGAGARVTVQTWHWTGRAWSGARTETWHWTARATA